MKMKPGRALREKKEDVSVCSFIHSGILLLRPCLAYLNKVITFSLVATISSSGSILKIAAFKNTYVALRERRKAASYRTPLGT